MCPNMIVSDSMLQKVDMPGLWFLKSSRPSSDISDLIYELSVKVVLIFL